MHILSFDNYLRSKENLEEAGPLPQVEDLGVLWVTAGWSGGFIGKLGFIHINKDFAISVTMKKELIQKAKFSIY